MKVSRDEIFSRKKDILSFVRERDICKNEDIAGAFGMSMSTVRRYVQQMEDEGTLLRYHGGVMVKADDEETVPYSIYSERNKNEKSAIMKYVAEEMMGDIASVFINGSSTALYIYKYLKKGPTIITNNAKVLLLDDCNTESLILLGGQPSSHNGENVLCGEFTTNMISSINAGACILGVSGISAAIGLTSSSPQDISVNRSMLSKTRGPKIIVADHSKIGKAFNFSFASIHSITHLVTDSQADPEELMRIRGMGVEVVTVEA